LDRDLIKGTVESLAEVVRREYMDPGVAARVDALLRQKLADETYLDAATPEALAASLTKDLLAATHDKHLAVKVVPDVSAGTAATLNSEESREERGRRSNFGVQRVEILPGNMGYVNITAFFKLPH
jgi:hypothetical protein